MVVPRFSFSSFWGMSRVIFHPATRCVFCEKAVRLIISAATSSNCFFMRCIDFE